MASSRITDREYKEQIAEDAYHLALNYFWDHGIDVHIRSRERLMREIYLAAKNGKLME